MGPDRTSHSALVARAHAGDARATEALARRACRLALRTACAILRNRDEASDIAQDVAVDVLRSLGRLRDAEAFDAWVHRITVRRTLRHLKRRARAVEVPLDAHEPPVDHTEPEAAIAARELLASALAELPARQRLALALRYVHDLSDAEIAEALGCRTGTVHALLSRGRTALRRNPLLAALLPAPGGAR
jgi:RNA polymerase sigma factor (sigma-70 family)